MAELGVDWRKVVEVVENSAAGDDDDDVDDAVGCERGSVHKSSLFLSLSLSLSPPDREFWTSFTCQFPFLASIPVQCSQKPCVYCSCLAIRLNVIFPSSASSQS
jgi:hypothetical protein